jgi:hypothetical protein
VTATDHLSLKLSLSRFSAVARCASRWVARIAYSNRTDLKQWKRGTFNSWTEYLKNRLTAGKMTVNCHVLAWERTSGPASISGVAVPPAERPAAWPFIWKPASLEGDLSFQSEMYVTHWVNYIIGAFQTS